MDEELWMNYGVLDTNESTNQQFYEANFVRIGYCSGDLYLGSRQEPDDSGLLFQGRFIVHGVLDDLLVVEGRRALAVAVVRKVAHDAARKVDSHRGRIREAYARWMVAS